MRVMKMPALVEPVPVGDDFVQGIAKIEMVGPCARFVLYADQTIVELGQPARVVVRKIVLPINAIPMAIIQAGQFMMTSTEGPAKVIPLVRR